MSGLRRGDEVMTPDGRAGVVRSVLPLPGNADALVYVSRSAVDLVVPYRESELTLVEASERGEP